MENFINQFDFTNLTTMTIWLVVVYAIVMLAMLVDLIAGVRKAIQLGIARTSTGYKKTCAKANKYYSPMIRLTFIDILASAFTGIPLFTMLWSMWCLFCEWKSVTEKALTKKELRDAENTMQVIIQNKGDLAQVLIEALHALPADKRDEIGNMFNHEGE